MVLPGAENLKFEKGETYADEIKAEDDGRKGDPP